MSYEILYAEGLGLDETAASLGIRYPGSTVASGAIISGSTLPQNNPVGKAFQLPSVSLGARSAAFCTPVLANSVADLFAANVAVSLSFQFTSLVAGRDGNYFGPGLYGLYPSNSALVPVFGISSAHPSTGAILVTLLSSINSTNIVVPSGPGHIEIVCERVVTSPLTLRIKVYLNGELNFEGTEVQVGTNERNSIRGAFYYGQAATTGSNTVEAIGDLVIAASTDDPNLQVGPLRVTPFTAVGTIVGGDFTNSGGEPVAENPEYTKADLSVGSYLEATTNTSALYTSNGTGGAPLGSDFQAIQMSMTAETEGSEVATMLMPDQSEGASITGAKTTVTSILQAPLPAPASWRIGLVASGFPVPPGQQEFSSTGGEIQNFVVPPGVTAISGVAVSRGGSGRAATGTGATLAGRGGAGGGLGYENDIAVTPGETLILRFGSPDAGYTGIYRGEVALLEVSNANKYVPGACIVGTGYTGGAAGSNAPSNTTIWGCAGGGGAAGYTANGGAGASLDAVYSPGNQVKTTPSVAATGGAASGGAARTSNSNFSPNVGGGTCLHGIGASGGASMSLGFNGSQSPTAPYHQAYGGGVAAVGHSASGIRIIWGAGRSFPNNAGDV